MGDVHTCSVGGVDLIGTVIGLARMKLPHLIRQMLRRTRVHVPVRINGVGLSMALRLLRRRAVGHSHLTRSVARILAVISETEETLLKTTMALGGPMSVKTTELADSPTPITR